MVATCFLGMYFVIQYACLLCLWFALLVDKIYLGMLLTWIIISRGASLSDWLCHIFGQEKIDS